MPTGLETLAPGDCVDSSVLNANFTYLLGLIEALQENPPPTPAPPGVVLVDGTEPMTGCLVLPDAGCVGNNHAVRWADLRAQLNGSSPFTGSVKTADNSGNAEIDGALYTGTTTVNGEVTVPLSGFVSTPIVLVTPRSNVIPSITAVSAGSFTVRFTLPGTANDPVATTLVSFNWLAYRG